jgi:hypothetical protein
MLCWNLSDGGDWNVYQLCICKDSRHLLDSERSNYFRIVVSGVVDD